MTVDWKEVADTLAHALQQANVSQGQAPLLAYRLACECERVAPAKPPCYVVHAGHSINGDRPRDLNPPAVSTGD